MINFSDTKLKNVFSGKMFIFICHQYFNIMKHICFIIILINFTIIQLHSQTIDTLWSENWEGDWFSNWYVDGGTWEVGIPTYGPDSTCEGTQCAATVLNGNYTESVSSRLIRFTKFTVPSSGQNPRLRFWHWFSFSYDDFGYVQIKTEHGAWQNISPQYFNTSSGIWTYTSIDLRAYSDSLVQIGFYFDSNLDGFGRTYVSSGWYIDAIQIISGGYSFNPNEGFENDLWDWSAERGVWEVGQPTSGPGSAYSGNNCLATILDGNYQEGMRTKFISPPFRVKPASESPAVRFWHWYSFSSDDFGEVYLKIINQDNWQIISNRFSGTSSGVWSTFYSDLTGYADSIVQIGFYFQSDLDWAGRNYVSSGWYIDDIRIDGINISKVIYPENDLAVQWLEPETNPLCGTLKEQPVTIQIENKGEKAVTNFEVGYSIDNGQNYVNETVFQTVDPGSVLEYTFRRKADLAEADSFNCLATVSIPYDINDTNDIVLTTIYNDRIIVDFETTDTKCNEATGVAEIKSISGREGPFQLYWTSGDEDMIAENLASETYFVTITDIQGCSWTKPIIINDEGAPDYSIAASSIKDISCYGRKDGSLYIFPTGGIPPYTYRWSNGAITQDISELSKGQYDVTITDSKGCAKTHSFTIGEPEPLKVLSSSMDADCGELNGSAELIVSGGAKPYNYSWSSGHTSNIVTNLPGGVYTVYVTDVKGCIDSARVSINEIDAPGIIVTSVNPASCETADGSINISVADDSYQYTYLWSDGSSMKDLQNASSGLYNIRVSYMDRLCSANQTIEIPTKTPPPGIICMVSVDSITGGNFIVTKDPEVPGQVASYNIYQLSKTGVYQYINNKDLSVANTTIDAASNAEVTSYRYRITTVDNCGTESEPGPFHETMHAVVTPDFNLTRANILWNSYKGVDYGFFKICRYSNLMGLEIIDTVPKTADNDFYTYTDLNPPLNDTVYYVIVIELPEPCITTKKAGSHNTIRSNRSKKLKFGEEDIVNPESIKHFNVYPNPNRGSFRISMEILSTQNIILRIFDGQGKMIRSTQYNDKQGPFEEFVEIHEIKPGIYHLQLLVSDGMISRSFIVD